MTPRARLLRLVAWAAAANLGFVAAAAMLAARSQAFEAAHRFLTLCGLG